MSLVNLDDESVAVGHCWAEAVGVAVNASIGEKTFVMQKNSRFLLYSYPSILITPSPTTAVQKLHDAEATVAAAKREVEDEEASDSNKKKSQNQSSGLSIKFQLRKGAQIGEAVTSCKTSHESLSYLTSWFKRVGGEAGVGLGGGEIKERRGAENRYNEATKRGVERGIDTPTSHFAQNKA